MAELGPSRRDQEVAFGSYGGCPGGGWALCHRRTLVVETLVHVAERIDMDGTP